MLNNKKSWPTAGETRLCNGSEIRGEYVIRDVLTNISLKDPIFGAIARGMAFGVGFAIAHRIVDDLMRPRTVPIETVASEAASASAAVPAGSSEAESEACGMQSKAFQDCLNGNADDLSKCQFYMDMLSECKRNSGSMMS